MIIHRTDRIAAVLLLLMSCSALAQPAEQDTPASFPSQSVSSSVFTSAYARLPHGKLIHASQSRHSGHIIHIPPCEMWWVECYPEINDAHIAEIIRLKAPGITLYRPVASRLAPQVATIPLRRIRLEGLRALTIQDTEVLAKLKTLQEIEIDVDEDTTKHVMDTTAAALRTLPDLRRVHIAIPTSESLSRSALADLAACDKLEYLRLDNLTERGDYELCLFKGHRSLRAFDFSGWRYVTNEGLRELGDMPRLESVDLRATGVTNDGLVHLTRWPKLKSLRPPYGLTKEGLRHITSCKSLEEIWYDPVELPNNLIHLRSMKCLRTLHLAVSMDKESALRDAQLKDLISLNQLHEIRSSMRPDIIMLGGWHEPELVNLSGTWITDDGVAALTAIRNIRKLSLGYMVGPNDIEMSPPMTDNAIALLSEFSKLEELDLQCARITDASLVHLAKIKSLRKLRLIGNYMVTSDAVRRLREAMPNCHIYHVSKHTPFDQ